MAAAGVRGWAACVLVAAAGFHVRGWAVGCVLVVAGVLVPAAADGCVLMPAGVCGCHGLLLVSLGDMQPS